MLVVGGGGELVVGVADAGAGLAAGALLDVLTGALDELAALLFDDCERVELEGVE